MFCGRMNCLFLKKMLFLDLCMHSTILVEANPEPNDQFIIVLLLLFKLMTRSLPHFTKVRSDLKWAAQHSGA